MRLFGRKRDREDSDSALPTAPVNYPSGVCVETESGRYYIKGGRKYLIRSQQVFDSWSFPLVVKSTDAAISHFKRSLRPLGFRDGTVIRDIFNLELYVISEGKRVRITGSQMYEDLGLWGHNIPYVSHEDVMFHREAST